MLTFTLSLCLIAASGWVLAHIVAITLYSSVIIYENSRAWLVGDWIVVMGFFLFGIYSLIKALRMRPEKGGTDDNR